MMYMLNAIIDTNVLLETPEILNEDYNFILPISVLEEIDGLKKSEFVGWKARRASHAISDKGDNIKYVVRDIYDNVPEGWDANLRDNKIILTAKENNAKLFSNDLNVRIKAGSIGVESESYKFKSDFEKNNNGWVEVELTDEELNDFYTNKENIFGVPENGYLIIKSRDTYGIIDVFRLDLDGFKHLKYKDVDSKTMGKIQPRNIHQKLVFDMMQDDKTTIKVVTGKFGTGKDYVMLAHAFRMLESGKFDKIIWCRNTIEVKDSKQIGFLKGTMEDKLMPYAMPMADHLGGRDGLERMLTDGTVELQHLGFIRGRDIKNTIIYCSEAENLTKEHVQLLIGRVGEGSVLFLNGDFKQVDETVFERNNGLNRMIDKLSGHKNFAHVKLMETERSETAAMADLLD